MTNWRKVFVDLADNVLKYRELNGRVQPAPGAGGSDGLVQVATTHLASPDILALNLTPIEITPAPPAGSIIVPLSTVFIYTQGAIPYTVNGSDDLYVSTIAEWNGPNTGFWWRQARLGFLAVDWSGVSPTMFPNGPSTDDITVAGADGQALAVFTSNPVVAYSDGDGTLDIVTHYTVLELP